MHFDEARRALATSRWELLAKRDVVAVGIGYKVTDGRRTSQRALVCSVLSKRPASQLARTDLIPATVGAFPTDVVQTGSLVALAERTARHRPAPGGVSVGHTAITAGTLGCLVRRDGRLHILSNNHVLANSNDAVEGDMILQPGPADGGRAATDSIARLSGWVPISFDGELDDGFPPSCPITRGVAGLFNALASSIGSRSRLRPMRLAAQAEENFVDAAIAEVLDVNAVSREILEVGLIAGLGDAKLGDALKKSGRTTAVTTGTVLQTDVTARVNYGAGRVATFSDQLMAGPMSQGGDSGSAVLDERNNLVGLLFAGSTNSTVINRVQHVFGSLAIALP